MHFTRDPIIETIITARDGYKILVRDVNHSNEEYFVDMVEVISLGKSCFYRSLEKPKPFLVPAGHFEVIEVREPRMTLKTSLPSDKAIKIGSQKEGSKSKETEDIEAKTDKKKDKKKGRKKKEKKEETRGEELPTQEVEESVPEVKEISEERRSLIPPPSTLISETISRYKNSSAIEELALENEPSEEAAEEQPQS